MILCCWFGMVAPIGNGSLVSNPDSDIRARCDIIAKNAASPNTLQMCPFASFKATEIPDNFRLSNLGREIYLPFVLKTIAWAPISSFHYPYIKSQAGIHKKLAAIDDYTP